MIYKYSTLAAAMAVALAGASPLALAQGARIEHRATTDSVTMIQPDQVRASKIVGAAVYDRNNVKIGSVDDLVLDRDGRVALVAVSVGGFLGAGSKDVAVSFNEIKTDHNRLTLDVTKQRLQQMAEYRLTNRNTGAGTTESPVHGGHLGSGSGR